MEGNIFNVPMDMTFQNSLITDTTFSLSHSNSQDPNTQNPIMSAFPVLSMLQGEPICDLNTGHHLLNRNPNPNPNSTATLIHSQFMDGIPISATSLATLLATRYNNPQENLNDDIIIPPVFTNPNEALKPNGYCDDTIMGNYQPLMGYPPFQLMGNLEPNRWISSENTSASSCSNELSLSLGTCQPICGNANPDPELSCSGLSSHSLGDQGPNKNLCLGFGSYKPVRISEVLSGSGYLHVMQEILAEIASFSLENHHQMSYPGGGIGGGANVSFSSSCNEFCDGDERSEVQIQPFFRGKEVEEKKKHMLALLEAVDDRYNQCMDEIHTVISAFHSVTDLDPQIHGRFAVQTVSFMYKSLRERISNYILAMGTNFSRVGSGPREEIEEKSFESSFIQKQWALQQLKRKDHQLWRPQRGLPEKSVAVLRAWMFQNFLHPYPKDAEKHLLAVKSGLTRSQVSNWFINARVRLWKPMIEEMYSEMNRRKNRRNDEESNRANVRNNISIDYQRFKMI